MMGARSRHRGRVLLPALLAAAAILGVAGSEAGHLLHHALEKDCPSRHDGDALSCWVCAHFHFGVAADLPAELAPPAAGAPVPLTPESIPAEPAREPLVPSARDPPRAS